METYVPDLTRWLNPNSPWCKFGFVNRKELRYPQPWFVESAHGDGDAQAAGEARRFVDRTHGVGSGSGHPCYQRLNELLEAEGFDEFVEGRCAKFYAEKYGRPSLPPGIYFRVLLIGYFEGIGAARGIVWRLADSLALRRFVGIALDDVALLSG